MHKVEKLLDVWRPARRKGLQLQVLVQYEGVDYFSRQAWKPEWVNVSHLTQDLVMEARRMEEERWPREAFRARPAESRKSARTTFDLI